MQHAHTEIAVQALNAFQVIVIHPKDLQVDLHTGNVQHAVSVAEDQGQLELLVCLVSAELLQKAHAENSQSIAVAGT